MNSLLNQMIKLGWENRKLYGWALGVAIVMTIVSSLCAPKYYQCMVVLAPESSGSMGQKSISSIAAAVGYSNALKLSNDAITPTLYPTLMGGMDFVTGLFDVNITTRRNELNTTYADYLLNHQKQNLLTYPIGWVFSLLSSNEPTAAQGQVAQASATPSVRMLTKKEWRAAKSIARNINCSVDKKTSVITIQVTDQDPWVAAQVADSVCAHLQSALTTYRQQKAKSEYEHAVRVLEESEQEYNEALQQAAAFDDANHNTFKHSVAIERTKLNNELNTKLLIYRQNLTSMISARSKVEENLPAFVFLQPATVPDKPAGPRKIKYLMGWMFLAMVGTSAWIVWKNRK